MSLNPSRTPMSIRSLPKRLRPKVTAIEESKNIEAIKLEELFGSLQTYEASIKELTKKNGIPLKVDEPSGSNEEMYKEFALVDNRFKKFFKRNVRDFLKNKYVEKAYPNYKKKSDSSNKPPICYECKGRGHIVRDYGHRKNKNYKPKGKAMVATWDDDSDESE